MDKVRLGIIGLDNMGSVNAAQVVSSQILVAVTTAGVQFLAPGSEGIHSVELANAMIHPSLQQQTVHLPLDACAYDAKLNELIASSTVVERAAASSAFAPDLVRSFSRSPCGRRVRCRRGRFLLAPNSPILHEN